MEETIKVVRYVKGEHTMEILQSSRKENKLVVFVMQIGHIAPKEEDL